MEEEAVDELIGIESQAPRRVLVAGNPSFRKGDLALLEVVAVARWKGRLFRSSRPAFPVFPKTNAGVEHGYSA